MRDKDIIESLQREIIIPDIVQTKADQTFQKIQMEKGKTDRKSTRLNSSH